MLTNLLGGLVRKRCPLCKAEIPRGGEGVVRRLGKLFCSRSHADTYEYHLYQALREFQLDHTTRHGDYAPLLVTSSLECEASKSVSNERQSEPGGELLNGSWPLGSWSHSSWGGIRCLYSSVGRLVG
jgi:hypothetical protein